MSDFEKELACMPASGANGLFIPWSRQLAGYDASYLKKDAAGGAVTSEELARTILELQKLGDLYPPGSSRCKSVWLSVVWLFCLGLAGGSLAVILSGDYSGKTKGAAIAVSVAVCLVLGLLLSFVVSGVSKRMVASREEERRAAAERATDWCNGNLFRGKSVAVRMSRMGAYLAFEHCGFNAAARTSQEDRELVSLKDTTHVLRVEDQIESEPKPSQVKVHPAKLASRKQDP